MKNRIKFNLESEVVLMIITAYGLIVFQLVIWIGFSVTKTRQSAEERHRVDMLGLAYPAILARHEVPTKTLSAKIINSENKPTKLLKQPTWSE